MLSRLCPTDGHLCCVAWVVGREKKTNGFLNTPRHQRRGSGKGQIRVHSACSVRHGV